MRVMQTYLDKEFFLRSVGVKGLESGLDIITFEMKFKVNLDMQFNFEPLLLISF
jgi:hypothetical protein